jgi:ABC-type branched-subunit amino acid transport system substrate-binding protein
MDPELSAPARWPERITGTGTRIGAKDPHEGLRAKENAMEPSAGGMQVVNGQGRTIRGGRSPRPRITAGARPGRSARWRLGAGLVAAAGLVTLSACASSSSSGSTPSSGSTSSAASTATAAATAPAASSSGSTATGSVLKIMIEGAISGPVYALPEMVTGAQAGVDRVNSEGGVEGHKLQLVTCDDQGNPNNDAACGRTAVSDGVVAVVGGLSVYDTEFIPSLQAANIPYIGSSDIVPDDHTSPVSFPINAAIVDYHGTAAQLARRGCKQAAVVAPDQPGVAAGVEAIKDGFLQSGGKSATSYEVPPTESDFTSLVATAQAGGAQCFALTTGPQQTAEMLLAIKKSGHILPVDVNITAIVPSLDTPVGFPAGDLTSNGTYYLPNAGATGTTATMLAQFVSDMAATHASGPAASVDALAENAYNSVLIFKDVAGTLPDITPLNVLKAMQHYTANTGLTAPITFSGSGPFAG